MADFNQVCKWLNQFEDTHLSSKAQSMMDAIDTDLGLPVGSSAPATIDIDTAVRQFVAHLEKSSDPKEFPEGMVRLARYYYTKGGASVAAFDILQQAGTVYRKLHGSELNLALLNWLKGLVHLQMFDTQEAHRHWKKATEGFADVIRIANLGGEYTKEVGDFAGEKLEMLWQAILQLPEEAFGWLDEQELKWITAYGGGFHMNLPTKQLKEVLLQRQRNDNFRGVYGDLEKFHKISKESVHSLKGDLIYGEGDALTVTGMLLFWMGNVPEARQKFSAAMDIYLPDTHPDAVVSWILGLMYLYQPNDKRKAVACCQRAIHGLKRVRFTADVKHDRTARDWYTEKIDLLEKTLGLIESGLFS